MTLGIRDLTACVGKTEKDPLVKRLLTALGVKLPPPKKERWKGVRGATPPVVVLNGQVTLVSGDYGVTLEFDFPEDRSGSTERPVSHRGPRSLKRIILNGKFAGPVLLDWSIAEPLAVLRRVAKEKGKAYARGPGKTPDSIRIGTVCFVIYRKKGNKLAERVEVVR